MNLSTDCPRVSSSDMSDCEPQQFQQLILLHRSQSSLQYISMETFQKISNLKSGVDFHTLLDMSFDELIFYHECNFINDWSSF